MTGLPKISAPAHNALEEAGVRTLEEAAGRTEKELLALHGFGPKGIRILREAFREHGLDFRKP